VNIEDRLPPEVVAATHTERFVPKKWETVQDGVFSYMFANLMGSLVCVFKLHETVWVVCRVPRPTRGKSRHQLLPHDPLPF